MRGPAPEGCPETPDRLEQVVADASKPEVRSRCSGPGQRYRTARVIRTVLPGVRMDHRFDGRSLAGNAQLLENLSRNAPGSVSSAMTTRLGGRPTPGVNAARSAYCARSPVGQLRPTALEQAIWALGPAGSRTAQRAALQQWRPRSRRQTGARQDASYGHPAGQAFLNRLENRAGTRRVC
jgi:hypothetical protein